MPDLSSPYRSKLSAKDYENLALVAQGQSSQLVDADAQRLLAANVVVVMPANEVSGESLQLTAEGLVLIRSSDQ